MRLPALLAVLLLAPAARADDPPTRLTGVGRRGGWLAMDVGVQDVIAPDDARRLTSGFATRVLVRVWVRRLGDPRVVAQATRLTEIVYDLWDEKFQVRSTDGAARAVATIAEATAMATELRSFPVAELSRLQAGARYQLTVQADLNPLSDELKASMRKWLARPPGQGRLAPGDSFFGSFVSFFINPRVDESERRVFFLSQPFVKP